MKNWIIALAILILPLVTYFVLDKTNGDKSNFEAVAASGKPAVIKFASAMCLDCKKMESMMCEVMPLYADKVVYEKIDSQSNDKQTQSMIKKYNVTVVPTVIFLNKDGSVYKKTEGAYDKEEFEKYLRGIING